MLRKSMTISEVRGRLSELPENLDEESAQPITRDNIPVLVVMSWKRYRALRETISALTTPDVLAKIKRVAEQTKTKKGLMSAAQVQAKMLAVTKAAAGSR